MPSDLQLMPASNATEPRWLSEAEAAQRLGLARATLEKWRLTGKPCPRYARFGRVIRYDVRELDAWASAQQCT
jgi:hypothetical protein